MQVKVNRFFNSMNEKQSANRWLISIIILAVLLRVGASLYMGDEVVNLPGIYDQISYDRLAQNLLAGNGFSFDVDWWPATHAGEPTAHWSYLMTGYLYFVYQVIGPHPLVARLIQAVLAGILMPWLTFRLGRYLRDRTVGLIAAGISAVYIYFFYYAAALMTETFFFLAVLGMLNAALDFQEKPSWRIAAWLGLALGCGVLLRQLLLLFVPILLVWLVWAARRRFQWRYLSVVLGIPFLMILPFTVRNFRVFDQFVLLNTNAGFAFFWANHPVHGTSFIPADEMDDYHSLIPVELRSLDEASLDKELLRLGIKFVLDDPVRYIKLSISRIPNYFWFWPSPRSGLLSNISRVGSFGLFLPFIIYGLFISICEGFKGKFKEVVGTPSFLFTLFIFSYSSIHILTWTMVRYRLPVDTVLVLFAALGGKRIIERMIGKYPLKEKMA